jgi:hypothetical protein
MGYGFVECDSEAAAKAAIKQLQVSLTVGMVPMGFCR